MRSGELEGGYVGAPTLYSQGQSQLLQSVDNYALLNLDIAWCYLCLQSVTHIPDAEQRLHKCEENFHWSYGPNLERLLQLKGTAGNDYTLMYLGFEFCL